MPSAARILLLYILQNNYLNFIMSGYTKKLHSECQFAVQLCSLSYKMSNFYHD